MASVTSLTLMLARKLSSWSFFVHHNPGDTLTLMSPLSLDDLNVGDPSSPHQRRSIVLIFGDHVHGAKRPPSQHGQSKINGE